MWRLLYNSLLLLASPAVIGILLAKRRCRRGLAQRLGLEDGFSGLFCLFGSEAQRNKQDKPNKPNQPEKPVIWIHAVSLGEVVAVAPLVRALHRRHPDYRYMVTTVTETGREAVEQRLAGVAEHRYAPLDFPWVVRRMLSQLQPVLYVFVETELWPNLLWSLAGRDIPAVLVNGRLSSRSFKRQDLPLVRSFYRSVLRSIRLCLMQSARDAQRMVALGAEPGHVHVTGNIKFDQPMPVGQADASLRTSLGLNAHDQLFLAGSTHAGEEEQLVSAYQQIVQTHPSAVLMLAPRHIERVDKVETMIRGAGLKVQRKSRLQSIDTGPRVIVLDTRGELARAYQEAAMAFVGGTLVPVGGHNLLEPAVLGRPVLFGPHTDHCADIATLLQQAGGGYRVSGAQDIVQHVTAWLSDPPATKAVGEAARRVVLENQGALERSLHLIESCLTSAGAAHSPTQSISSIAMARP
jgi:3-deoxy-D-manno-octulosonic-acid transferase